MSVEENNTLEPLAFIQRCVREHKIYWTYHVNMRLKERFIPRSTILESIDKYEVIEEYPKDKYLPSYLVYSEYKGEVFHILFSIDVEGDNVRIITVYRPNPRDWEDDLKTRRKIQ